MYLVWLRADLRTVDNPALFYACMHAEAQGVGVIAVYVFSPEQWKKHNYGDARIDFERRTLAILAKQLAGLNIPLKIIHAALFENVPTQLLQLCQTYQIKQIYANRQYEWNEVERDRACHLLLKKQGITIEWHHDQCIVAPPHLSTATHKVYTVFSPFKRAWLMHLENAPVTILPIPKIQRAQDVCSDPIPEDIAGYHATPSLYHDWPAGAEAALNLLTVFCEESLHHYKHQRDFPSITGTSRLAAYLAVGAISAKQCWFAARHKAVLLKESVHIDTWISELAWRDFYRHILVGYPYISRGQPFKLNTRNIAWLNNSADFTAWCTGQTGYPIIDAAMRCLNATGWMHNRLRMITAMFLVKDLLMDWRWGEAYFMQHLLDADFASNNGGWQWCASTGCDAVPYFRIFNPELQSQKFDADGAFIRQWVPELKHISAKHIHAPSRYGVAYITPIVEHSMARLRAIQAYKDVSALKQL